MNINFNDTSMDLIDNCIENAYSGEYYDLMVMLNDLRDAIHNDPKSVIKEIDKRVFELEETMVHDHKICPKCGSNLRMIDSDTLYCDGCNNEFDMGL